MRNDVPNSAHNLGARETGKVGQVRVRVRVRVRVKVRVRVRGRYLATCRG